MKGLSPCVSVCPIDQTTGHILLAKRRSPSRWELPGGFVESDECLLSAAHREFLEEVGARGYSWRPQGVSIDQHNNLFCLTYSCLVDEVDCYSNFIPNREVSEIHFSCIESLGGLLHPIYLSRVIMTLNERFMLEQHNGSCSTLDAERRMLVDQECRYRWDKLRSRFFRARV